MNPAKDSILDYSGPPHGPHLAGAATCRLIAFVGNLNVIIVSEALCKLGAHWHTGS